MRSIRIFCISLLCGSTLLAEDQPTAEEVLAAVLRQPLSITNSSVKSYEIEMVSMGMRANFWYRKPEKTALWVIDALDGTPVMAVAGGTAAVYNPLISNVLLFTNLYGGLRFSSSYSQQPGKSGVCFNFNVQGDPKQVEADIRLPSGLIPTNIPVKLKPLGEGRYEVQASETRQNPKTGERMTWAFAAVTDWPPGEVPYRSLEIRGGRFLNLNVKSVNKPITDACFEFPLQALLTSGLPIRRLSADAPKDVSQMAGILTASISIRGALATGDSSKAKETIRGILKNFGGRDSGREIEKLYGDSQAVEKMLAEMTPEQWESTRTQLYADRSPEEFAKMRQDPAFRLELAKKIVEGMSKPLESENGAGVIPKETLSEMMSSFSEVARSLDSLDIEALRAKDQKIAAQLRQAFQLDLSTEK